MNANVEILNRRLGEALGRPNGNDPRFMWKHSTELFYYFRMQAGSEWQKRCWADRLGKAWVLCKWNPPMHTFEGVDFEITRDEWFKMFGWSRPYPRNGEYMPFAETALGVEPDGEVTQFYISTIRQQLEAAEQAQKMTRMGLTDKVTEMCERDAQKVVDDHEKEFFDSVADWEPESWKHGVAHEPGDVDVPVERQAGIGESPIFRGKNERQDSINLSN